MEYENEKWVVIKKPFSFGDKYAISDLGRVKRLPYVRKIDGVLVPEKIRSLCKKSKYIKIALLNKGKMVNISIHRLVCLAFHANPEKKPQVNHINGDKYDNRAINLEWCTQSENIKHAQSLGIMKYAKPKPPKKEKWERKKVPPRYKKIINIETNEEYHSVFDIEKITGIKAKELRRMMNGERFCRIPYRYLTKNGVNENVKMPPPPKEKTVKVKKERPPKKVYVPHPLPTKNIFQYGMDGLFIKKFESTKEAAIFIGSGYDTFRKAIKRSPNNFHKNYIWKYNYSPIVNVG